LTALSRRLLNATSLLAHLRLRIPLTCPRFLDTPSLCICETIPLLSSTLSKSDNDTTKKNHQQVDGKKSVPGSPKRMCCVWWTLGYWLSLLYQLVFRLGFGFLYLTFLFFFLSVFSISIQTRPHVLCPILMLSIILDT